MNKIIDMLISLKKPWLDHVSDSIQSLGQENWHPTQQDISKFWDLTSEAYLRGEIEAIKSLLEAWLQTYFASEMDTGKLASDVHPVLIPLLSTFEHASISASTELFNEEDRLRIFDVIVAIFNQFYELAATLELDMYMHEVRRREQAVRTEVQRLDETRSRFINTAAHELKTPLTLIEGYAEMLGEILEESSTDPDH
jgi:signal transduction histidine kinase